MQMSGSLPYERRQNHQSEICVTQFRVALWAAEFHVVKQRGQAARRAAHLIVGRQLEPTSSTYCTWFGCIS